MSNPCRRPATLLESNVSTDLSSPSDLPYVARNWVDAPVAISTKELQSLIVSPTSLGMASDSDTTPRVPTPPAACGWPLERPRNHPGMRPSNSLPPPRSVAGLLGHLPRHSAVPEEAKNHAVAVRAPPVVICPRIVDPGYFVPEAPVNSTGVRTRHDGPRRLRGPVIFVLFIEGAKV